MTCFVDPAEIAHVEQEMAKKSNNLGVGVLDLRNSQVRLVPFDETDAFSQANPTLQVMTGHEAAAAMVGIPLQQVRGFVLAKLGIDWHVLNQSHLNRADRQPNAMRMAPPTFAAIVSALQAAARSDPDEDVRRVAADALARIPQGPTGGP